MKLSKLLEGVDIVSTKNFKNINIKSVTHISNDVIKGSMFICLKGNSFDGNDYIMSAIDKGAKCIITSDDVDVENIIVIVVKDERMAMSIIAKNFYHRCADDLYIVGVVGTSGKTTITHIIKQLLEDDDKKVCVIGTNGVFIGETRLDNYFTTPDPLELHYIFYQMKLLGIDIVIMEVSAQAIYYKKVFGIKFDKCVFTNITPEHLDFFETFEKYAKVKMDFFNGNNICEAIVNTDDFFGRELAYKINIPCISYGIKEPANAFAIEIEENLNNTKFIANIIDDIFNVDVSFVGYFNIYNILASLTVAKLMGVGCQTIQNRINKLKPIAGRFNVYSVGYKKIVVDFAHTPDSIDKLLSHIKSTSNLNIISVFGCVGYSNEEKRQEFGRIVSKYSKLAILTTDNRGNTPFIDICMDIASGLNDCPYVCIEDREQAIKYGYSILKDGEILVLIGKGAEDFQKIGEDRVRYSDLEVVDNIINQR